MQSTRRIGPLIGLLLAAACTHQMGEGGESETCYGADECAPPFETGDETGPVILEEGECVKDSKQNGIGVRHGCVGDIQFDVEFDVVNGLNHYNCAQVEAGFGLVGPNHDLVQALCHEDQWFGDEAYEQTQVTACCGPWTHGDGRWPSGDGDGDGDPEPYLEACEYDLGEAVCLAIESRLKYHNQPSVNHFATKVNQIQNMIDWLSMNTVACANEISANDSNPDPTILASEFTFDNSEDWEDVDDFTVTINVGNISGFYVPDEGQMSCTSTSDNNENVFPVPWYEVMPEGALYDNLYLQSSTEASLGGPLYGGNRIVGSQTISNQYDGCDYPWCSSAAFVEDETAGGWEITRMKLYADDTVTLSNGVYSFDIHNVVFEIALGTGYIVREGAYKIDAGDASFVLTGRGETGFLWQIPVSNQTDIEASLYLGEWTLSGFTLEYVDYNSDTWEIDIAASTWM